MPCTCMCKNKKWINVIRCQRKNPKSKHWSLKATNSNETLLIEKIRNNSFLNTFISGNFVPSFNGLLINVVINEAFILQLHHKIHLKPNTVILPFRVAILVSLLNSRFLSEQWLQASVFVYVIVFVRRGLLLSPFSPNCCANWCNKSALSPGFFKIF